MKIYNLNELKSSNIQYTKKDPRMGFWIIGVTLLFLIGITITASFIYKTEIVRSTGVFSTINKSYIMSQTGGKIKVLHKQNGDYVNEGELIIELDATQVEAQILSLEYKEEYLISRIDKFEIFIDSLTSFDYETKETHSNPFTRGEFYLQYDSFLKSLEGIETTKTEEDGGVISKTEDEIKKEKRDIVNQYLSQYYSQKGQYNYEYSGVKGQKEAYELTLKSYKIYASKSGYINYSSNLISDIVIGNDPIGTINEGLTNDNTIIETYVDAGSRPYIKEGYDVEIAIAGLSQSEYGIINGKIISISSDSILNDDKVYYKVTIKPNNIKLSNGKKIVEIVTGQFGEIRIKYEESTWIKWAIKKTGIFN